MFRRHERTDLFKSVNGSNFTVCKQINFERVLRYFSELFLIKEVFRKDKKNLSTKQIKRRP